MDVVATEVDVVATEVEVVAAAVAVGVPELQAPSRIAPEATMPNTAALRTGRRGCLIRGSVPLRPLAAASTQPSEPSPRNVWVTATRGSGEADVEPATPFADEAAVLVMFAGDTGSSIGRQELHRSTAIEQSATRAAEDLQLVPAHPAIEGD